MIFINASNSDQLGWPIDDQQLFNTINPLTTTGLSSIGLDPYSEAKPKHT